MTRTNLQSAQKAPVGKLPYEKPRLEHHGPWNAIVLAQSQPGGNALSPFGPSNLNPLDALLGSSRKE